MTIARSRKTIAPSALNENEISQVAQFFATCPSGTGRTAPFLTSPEGVKQEIPARVYEVLTFMVDALADGQGVTVAPTNAQLTTQQAAEFLHMSRPTLVKLLENGDIPFTKVGRHRRVLLADLKTYEDQLAEERRHFLGDQTRQAMERNEYFSMPADHQTR